MDITLHPGYGFQEDILTLFSEYTRLLVEGDPAMARYLSLQNYDEERRHLTEKYGLPRGRLYLARWGETPAGCVALKEMDGARCEMKRFYVRPQFRGRHVGRLLMEQIITDAKEIGYTEMLLDTLPFLDRAIQMYRSRGFQEVPKYNDNPIENSIYLRLEL
ncbi:MAG: GNAT family N-acetyltransferase [Lawsonibacter sp.]|nr:GNAT family N-acetyltransferase [Lawsonibacter sp.]